MSNNKNLNALQHNSNKKSPNRLDGNNEFKINDCIRMHNEASNLNSTLILTENEFLVDELENDVEEENVVEATNRMLLNENGSGEENKSKHELASGSLDLNILDKIMPIPTDLPMLKSPKEKTTMTSLIASEDTVKSSDYSSDTEFY